MQNQTLLVHPSSDLDDLLLRKDGPVECVLEGNDLGWGRVNVVAEDEIRLDVVLEGEVMTVGGRDSCGGRREQTKRSQP